jgi:hypothetical protein
MCVENIVYTLSIQVVDFVRRIQLKCNLSNQIRGVCVKESASYLKMRLNKMKYKAYIPISIFISSQQLEHNTSLHLCRQKMAAERLKAKYTNLNNTFAFTGSSNVSRTLGKKHQDNVTKILNEIKAFSLHRPARKHFPRRRVICPGLNHQFHADLIDLKKYKRENDNMQYVLTVIDCLSKWGAAVPVKNKTATVVAEAFEKIMSDNNRFCKSLQVDMGKEFYGQAFLKMLSQHNIKIFSTFSEIKNSICERFNRTVMERLSRYWTHAGHHRYIDVLPALINNYNNSFHRSIKTKPILVTKENEIDVFNTLYKEPTKSVEESKFKVGDVVRIQSQKAQFDKGYQKNWSNSLYRIDRIKQTVPHHYMISNVEDGEEILGGFYDYELQKI